MHTLLRTAATSISGWIQRAVAGITAATGQPRTMDAVRGNSHRPTGAGVGHRRTAVGSGVRREPVQAAGQRALGKGTDTGGSAQGPRWPRPLPQQDARAQCNTAAGRHSSLSKTNHKLPSTISVSHTTGRSIGGSDPTSHTASSARFSSWTSTTPYISSTADPRVEVTGVGCSWMARKRLP
jgi:hypothetical protein